MKFDPLSTDKPQHHIRCLPGDVADKVLLPGDPKRAERIAQFLDDARHIATNREYATYTGVYKGMPVSVTSTGIGCPSLAIAVEELTSVGAKTLIRTGTSGSMTPDVRAWRGDRRQRRYTGGGDRNVVFADRVSGGGGPRHHELPAGGGRGTGAAGTGGGAPLQRLLLLPPRSGPAPGGSGDAGKAGSLASGRGARVGDGNLHPVYSRVHAAAQDRFHLHGGQLPRCLHPPDARRVVRPY